MTAVVFLGPTLPVAEARTVLDAIYLPPAAQGDFVTATVQHRPTAIGLVDGVFLQSLSVWHKEILYALDRGIRVYGASSMGALRAAETAVFGMEGIGEIYRSYAEGLEDDDEVALAHTSAGDGYRKLSEPMVNVRATLAAALRSGTIVPAVHDAFVALAKEIYFAERTFPVMFAAARAAGLPRDSLDALAAFVATGYVDQKRDDAIAMLAAMRADADEPSRNGDRPASRPFMRSTHFNTLYDRGRRVRHGDVEVALETVGNSFALQAEDFDDVNFRALNRALVMAFADHLGIRLEDHEVQEEADRFRAGHELTGDAALDEWLEANHLDAEEFRDLMASVAMCRRMHRWFLIANWMGRTTKVLLDELRLDGRYPEWLHRTAAQERVLRARPDLDERAPIQMPLDDLVEEHVEWSGRRLPVEARRWAEEAGFHTADNLRAELKRARTVRQALLHVLAEGPLDADAADDP